MGLPAALKAHKSKDFKNALLHYERAYQQKEQKAILFQNYGALLREQGHVDRAHEIYLNGLKLHPNHRGIRQNFANLLRRDNPVKSFEIHLSLLQEKILAKSENILEPKDIVPVVELLECLGCFHWAYRILQWSFDFVKPDPNLLLLLFKISSSPQLSKLFKSAEISNLVDSLDCCISEFSVIDQAEYYFALANFHLLNCRSVEAMDDFARARRLLTSDPQLSADDREKAEKLNNRHSWNVGCNLLTLQKFEEGWPLFEYGLRTEAIGPQKWQRALPKPFRHDQCPLWRGENLSGKRILLLEEQAIGDVMQFLTLIRPLLHEASSVALLISDRLTPLYQRAFKSEVSSGSLHIIPFSKINLISSAFKRFDYQSPLGSICQYRFTDLKYYGNNMPILRPDSELTMKFRQSYLEQFPHANRIVGISWRGGGRADRIKQKSLPLELFTDLLKGFDDILFVSLQYGESLPVVNNWLKQNINVIHDNSVDALKDLDRWTSQVAACDAVVSVANTTIHGSGGLNIPTYCLLSQDSDWRWFKNPSVQRSYWYPSVGIARQSKDRDWSDAVQTVRDWLSSGTVMPDGAQFI